MKYLPHPRVSAILAVLFATGVGPSFVAAGIITYLPFDTSPGSINGIGGTFVGDAQLTTGGGGISGEALLVDGNGDYVAFAHPTSGSPVLGPLTSFTVSMWVNPGPGNTDFQRLMAVFRDGEDDFRNGNFEVGASQGSGATDRFGFESRDLFGTNSFNVGTPFTQNQWHHVAAVVDQDANSVTLYMNLVNTNSISTATADFTYSDNDRVFIGAGNNPTFRSGIAHFFNGRIDELQVYDNALSETDIAFLFNNPGSTLNSNVPEPTSLALLATGAFGFMGYGWRRKRKQAA